MKKAILLKNMNLTLILFFCFQFNNKLIAQEKTTYYYYSYYIERSGGGSFSTDQGYPENYRPKMWYTIVKSVKCDGLNYADNGVSNNFRDYLEAKYDKLPYGDLDSRVYESRKEAEESRLKNIAVTKKYLKYRLTELEYFNYYCD